jgi:PAS domain S-box-containing protein
MTIDDDRQGTGLGAPPALHAARALSEIALDLLPNPLVHVAADLRVDFANRAAQDLIAERRTPQAAGEPLFEELFTDAAARETLRPHVEAARIGHGSETIVDVRGAGPGRSHSFLVRFVPEATDDRPCPFFAVFDDVTRLQRVQAALRDGERTFRNLANGVPMLIWTCNLQGELTFANAAWLGFTGIDPGPGAAFHEAIHPDDRDAVRRLRSRLLQQGLAYETRLRLRGAHGAPHRWFLEHGTPDVDARGEIRGGIGCAVDITRLRQAEDERQSYLARLERAARLTTAGQMTSAIVHEVAQPIGAIQNFLQAGMSGLEALDVRLPETSARMFERAADAARRAGEVAKNMRSFLGRGRIERTITDVASLVRETGILLRDEAELAKVRVTIDAPQDELCAEIDKLQIQQVLCNLVRNAVEAVRSRDGGAADDVAGNVVLRIASTPSDPSIVVEVEDDGPGVSPNVREHLFEALQSDKPDGLGLGLWICWNILERHHGRIELRAETSGRTVFAFSLPRTPSQKSCPSDRNENP